MANALKTAHYFVLFLSLPHLLHTWRSFEIVFTGYRYEVNDNRLVQHLHIELVPFKQRLTLNGSVIFAQNLDTFNVELVVVVPRINFIDTQFNMTFDGCQLLDGASAKFGNLIKIITSEFRLTTSYFPERCPVLKHRPITLENFFIDPDKFPPYVPEMNFIAHLHLLVDRKYILKTFLNGSVVYKKNMKRKKGRKLIKE